MSDEFNYYGAELPDRFGHDPDRDRLGPQRVPVYFADVESFADYYGLELDVARARVHRLAELGYLEPATIPALAVELGLAKADDPPPPGWTVHVPLPQERRGRPS